MMMVVIAVFVLAFLFILLDESSDVKKWEDMRRIVWRNGLDKSELAPYETWKVAIYRIVTFDRD